MRTQKTPRKKVNGKGSLPITECPHAHLCIVNDRHEAVMTGLDALNEQMCNALIGLSDVRERQTVSDQRETEWLSVLTRVETALRTLGGSNA